MPKILKKLKKVLKKLKVNKIFKIFIYILVVCGFLLLFAEFALRYLLPLPSIKHKILEQASKAIGAQLKAGEISAGLFNIEIEGVALDSDKTNLFTCKNIKIRQNLIKLLKGEISVDNIYVNEPIIQIIRYKDGSFNFEEAFPPSENKDNKDNISKDTAGGAPLDLIIKNLYIRDGRVIYLDLQEDIRADIDDFELVINDFSFYQPFDVNLSFKPYLKQKDLMLEDIKFALKAHINLQQMFLEKANLDLTQFLLKYKGTLLKLQAQVNNFEEPKVEFSGSLKDLSDETLLAFAKIEPFSLPLIEVKGKLDYIMSKDKLQLNQLIVKSENTQIDLQGNFDFAKDLKAKGKIVLTSVLDSLSQVSPVLEEYKPTGEISAGFDFAWPLALSGKLNLKEIGFFIPQAGTFEKINTSAEVQNIDNIKIEELSGFLNKNAFKAKAKYSKRKDFANITFDFKADKLYFIDTSEKKETSPSDDEQTQTSEQTQTAQNTGEEFSFVPLNIDAKIDIAKFDVPYLKGTNFKFKADTKNVTSNLDKIHGTFDLNIEQGQIKDVYKLANANALTKVMFMSLGIVSRVINTLNVLDLLSGIGKVVAGSDKDDEEIAHQEIKGKLDYDSFETSIDFNQGLATMEKCSFVSPLFSFRVKGDINFDSRNINLKVNSAPGKHKDNGIMPVNIDIGGTIEEPKGSLGVISSVSTLVGDTVKNNPVSNMLKSVWGKLFSSDKKKKEKEADNSDTVENQQTEIQEEQSEPEQESKEE